MDEIALSMARDNLAVEKVAMMEGGIHKRLVASRTIVPSSESAVISPNAPKSSGQRGSFFRWIRCGKVLWTLLHFMGIAVYMYGWIARISLHNGSECEMTYSYPNFIQVETRFQSPSKLSDSYKLYKFVDGRDPRYQHLLQSTAPVTGTSHCGGSNATLVLYIPGHWGSYHQARSLGAHGTQWTRPRENPQKGQQALAQGSWSGKEAHLHDFVYEVYALDFAEQGGALHARFLERQSDFAAYVMTLLTDTCQVDHILVVAHSMGGYVARLAPQRHPHIQKLVPNILTLATPHQNPLYAFDESISQLHSSSLINTWMLSISGGVRDEMIAPQACRLEHGYSYLSTTLMTNGLLGMDHRAIVWCHGLLGQVRKILWIWTQEISQEEQRQRIIETLGTMSYEKDVTEMNGRLSAQFGTWRVMAMESAMLYNLPMLYGLYAIVAGFHCAFPGHYYLPFLGTLPMLLWSDVSLPVLFLLLLVCNSIHFLLITLLHALSFRLVLRSWRLESMIFMLLGILAPLTIGCLLWNDAWSIRGLTSCIIYGAGIVAMMLACLWLVGQSSNRVPFVALVLIATPGILAGSIALMLWEQNVDARSWWIWARLIIPVFGVCRYGKSTACSSHNATTRALLVLLAVLGTGRNLVMMGNSFRVGHLVFAVSLVEVCLQVRHEHVRESKKEFQHAD